MPLDASSLASAGPISTIDTSHDPRVEVMISLILEKETPTAVIMCSF